MMKASEDLKKKITNICEYRSKPHQSEMKGKRKQEHHSKPNSPAENSSNGLIPGQSLIRYAGLFLK